MTSTKRAVQGIVLTDKFKPCVASCSSFCPLLHSMLGIKKIARILQTDMFTNTHKRSSYNTMDSFPLDAPTTPFPSKQKQNSPSQSTAMQIYGSWFQSMKRNAVWSRGRARREDMEQKVAFNGGWRQTDTRISFWKAGIFPPRAAQFTTNTYHSVTHRWGPALPPSKEAISSLALAGSSTEQRHETTTQHPPSATLIPTRWGSQNPTLPWRTSMPVHPWV